MGCGAGHHRHHDGEDDDVIQSDRKGVLATLGRAWHKVTPGAHHEEDPFAEGIPDGIVLCSATRPDWGRIDYFVFEFDQENADQSMSQSMSYQSASMQSSPSRMSFGSMKSSPTSRSDGGTKKKTSGPEKGGRFFSKRQECVGTWKISGNVLSLVWPFINQTDTVIAVSNPRSWINQQTNLVVTVLEPKENPRWFQPSHVADKFQSETVSSKAFECPVCYFELFKFPTGVIRQYSRRCCGHYFHKDCAQYLLRAKQGSGSASCPLCGVSFCEVKAMPDLACNPRDWFAVCDVDFGGELDTYEVVEALGCVLPVNRHKLEKNVKAHWHEWDPDGDGTITLQEFIMPQRGLKDWIISHLSMLIADGAQKPNMVPSIDRNPREWFHYWDRDGNGSLEKDEVIRAFIRTFCRDENGNPSLAAAHDMREITESLWNSLAYKPFDALSFEEFVRPYGFMDQFLHNQTHCTFFGLDCEMVAK